MNSKPLFNRIIFLRLEDIYNLNLAKIMYRQINGLSHHVIISLHFVNRTLGQSQFFIHIGSYSDLKEPYASEHASLASVAPKRFFLRSQKPKFTKTISL